MPDPPGPPGSVTSEPIRADGFRLDGKAISFDLPVHRIQAHAYHYGSFASHEMPLNGLILEPDENRLTLLYRCFIAGLFDGFELRRIALGCADHPADLSL